MKKKIELNGMHIPEAWFNELQYKTEKGTKKAYILAILILSDIVYYYNLNLNNFDGVENQYLDYADKFGSTRIAVKRAIDFLIKEELIIREFRDILTYSKIKITNVMFLFPIVKNIEKINKSKKGTKKVYPDRYKHNIIISRTTNEKINK
jgi:hypothetical protein